MGAYHSREESAAARDNISGCHVPSDCTFDTFWTHWNCANNDELQELWECQKSHWDRLEPGTVVNGKIPKPENQLLQFVDVYNHMEDGGGKYFTKDPEEQACLHLMSLQMKDSMSDAVKPENITENLIDGGMSLPVSVAYQGVDGFSKGMLYSAFNEFKSQTGITKCSDALAEELAKAR